MNSLVQFLASMNGRVLRAVAGIILIVLGVAVVGGTAGWIIAIVGLIPLAAGVFDFCVMAPLMGFPFWGRDIRQRTR